MSSAPSFQIISLPTAHLFYIASLCSLASGPLWFGLSNYYQRLKVTDKESRGQNGLVWGQSGFKGKRYLFGLQASKTELQPGECSVHQLQPFSSSQRKNTSCLCSQHEQKRNRTLFKECDLIELGYVKDFIPEMISVALSLCLLWDSKYQIKNQR